jgi:hypothetical protein
MRPGMRASAPARADRATRFATQIYPWGQGQLKGWLSPYLSMAPASNQNYFGNLHAQTGSNTTTTGNGSMAFSVLGDNFAGRRVVINGTVSGTALTVNSITSGSSGDIAVGMAVLYAVWQANGATDTRHIVSGTYPNFTLSGSPGNATSVAITLVDRYLGIDGQPAFSRVTDPQDTTRQCWKHRLAYEDYRPSGQDDTTAGLRKVLARFSDSGSEPSDGLGLVQPYDTYYMDMFAVKIDAATRAIIRYGDSQLLWQHKNSIGQPGLAMFQWAGEYRGAADGVGAPQIGYAGPNNPRLMLRLWNGTTNGNYIVKSAYAADTWIYILMRVKAHVTDGSAHTQCWVAQGNDAAVKAVDTTRGNSDAAAANVFRQWGWYLFDDLSSTAGDGVNRFATPSAWWGAGQELNCFFKEMSVAPQWRADAEPPLWHADHRKHQGEARSHPVADLGTTPGVHS